MPEVSSRVKDPEIFNEPDWTQASTHRVGLRNREGRVSGLTHEVEEWKYELEEFATKKVDELRRKAESGELLTVRDFITKQEDFHLKRPTVHPPYWRYSLRTTESFIKYEQPWVANLKRNSEKETREKDKQATEDQTKKEDKQQPTGDKDGQGGDEKHENSETGDGITQEVALLQALRDEAEYMKTLKMNDGKGQSPVSNAESPMQIDEADQFSPDNWIARSNELIRLTGKHPLNAECELQTLFEAGLITPNYLHYVRNHGAVPKILWENHHLMVCAGQTVVYRMDELVENFESINIPVFLACDGARRKELNMIRRSTSFNYTAAAASCAYWKGLLLRDVLLATDISNVMENKPHRRLYVNFEGADSLSEGQYSTSIPLEYVMDQTNDVLLAHAMNDCPLPPDHGYPLRLMIPGFIGGRCVKWLSKIWITEHENDSYYHIYDNRVLPSFIVDKESELAETMFRHPSTACYQQTLNSIIVKPTHGEMIDLSSVKKAALYRIEGFAYNGGGNEVQKVEVSLDGGKQWQYCIRKYPDAPVRHGNKWWTWLHWHIDVDITRLIRAESIIVRCFDVNKNTQPSEPIWNLEGMMNNCWYRVKLEVDDDKNGQSFLLFRHPCEQGSGMGGWMKPSTENQIEDIKRKAATPQREFTRDEIEKHHTEDDCWIVVNNRVYNATSVLSWHPGGKTAILSHAGRVYMDTTEEYEGIHDEYAHNKLEECVLGTVTKKTRDYMKSEAELKAKQRAQGAIHDPSIALNRNRWIQARLNGKTQISEDTFRYTFSLVPPAKTLGLEVGQHIQVGFHFADRLVFRPYTPTRPILDSEEDGTFDLTVKTYYPDANQPGGTMSNVLNCLRQGEEVEIKGPSGEIKYHGSGRFVVDGKEYLFDNITLILGGSGITPGYQLITRILKSDTRDKTKIKVIDANKEEIDILMYEELKNFADSYSSQFQIVHVLSRPSKDWKGLKGHIDERIIHENSFEPDERSVMLLCGPPAMIQKAVLPVVKEWGYEEDKNLFGF